MAGKANAVGRAEPGGQAHPAEEQEHYLAVLNSLQKKKRELEIAISTVTQLIEDIGPADQTVSSAPPEQPVSRQPLRLIEAVKNVLDEIGRPARNAEIKQQLLAHGYGTEAANLDVSIIQALNRLSDANVVAKIGRGLWAKRNNAPKA